jgi:hypothetical protein
LLPSGFVTAEGSAQDLGEIKEAKQKPKKRVLKTSKSMIMNTATKKATKAVL